MDPPAISPAPAAETAPENSFSFLSQIVTCSRDLELPSADRIRSSLNKSECQYSFDTPESPDGLLVSLATLQACAPRFAALEIVRSGARAFVHVRARRARRAKVGGFDGEGKEEEFVEFEHALVVFPSSPLDTSIPAPSTSLPLSSPLFATLPLALRNVCEVIATAEDALLKQGKEAALSSFEEPREVSRFSYDLVQLARSNPECASPLGVSPSARAWACMAPGCDKVVNLWLNLSSGFIGCGRPDSLQLDGGGRGHAQQHFRDSGRRFPLSVKLGTISSKEGSAGVADVYSYAEDDMVVDAHLAEHLAHWGIDVYAMEKTAQSLDEMALEANKSADFGRIMGTNEGAVEACVSGPGLIGLENLGNSCYINSVLQAAVLPVHELREGFLREGVSRALFESVPRGSLPSEDLLCQTAKLFEGCYEQRYAKEAIYVRSEGEKGLSLASPPTASDLTASSTHTFLRSAMQPENAFEAATVTPPAPRHSISSGGPSGFVTPRMLRSIVGKGHADFSTGRQQDATEFFMWLVSRFQVAHQQAAKSPARASIPLPPQIGELFSFFVEERLECLQTRQVRYRTVGGDTLLRLDIPLEAAENKAIVDAARVADAAELAAEKAAKTAERAHVSSDALSCGTEAKRARMAGEDAAGTSAPPFSTTRPEDLPPARSGVPRYRIPFGACLQAWAASSTPSDFVSPATGLRGTTLKAQRLASFPPYLAVCLNRYKLAANWAQVKVDAEVPVPLDLDLADLPERASFGDRVPSLRAWGGLQLGETAMIEGAAGIGGGVGERKPGPRQRVAYDSDVVAQLLGIGFPDGACKRASAATASNGSGLDSVLEWLAARMDDPDFGAEYAEEGIASVPTSSASASSADVAVLTEMGFSEARARRALRETQGSVERATDWLFSHDNDGMDEVEVVKSLSASSALSVSNSGSTAERSGGGGSAILPSSSSRYTILSIISHLGSNTASGHYVAHVRKVPGGKGAPSVTGDFEGE